jgi:acyl-CoA synthetase (AMP-forming)/AMP-acid ligase II
VNVAELLAGPVAESPDAPALIEGPLARARTTTFAELDAQARRIAHQFRAVGIGPGDGVLFFAAPSAELYAALVAVFRIGAVAIFVETSAKRSLLDDACAMRPPRALVASPLAHLLRLRSSGLRGIPKKFVTRGWIPGASRLVDGAPHAADDAIARVEPGAPALLTFTSGSTGTPKGAIRTHDILHAQLSALSRSFAARAGERELVSLPIVVLINLANGATSILPDCDLRRPGEIDGKRVLAQMRGLSVTRVTASPALLERLVDAERAAPATVAVGSGLPAIRATERSSDRSAFGALDAIVTGGGPVFPDLVARLRAQASEARVISVYGSTEAEPVAHIEAREVSDADRSAMQSGAGLLAGHIDAVTELRILRRQWGSSLGPLRGAELEAMSCAVNEPGEIVVTGAHVVQGYVNGVGDEETKIRVDDRIWHRTGDIGYLDASDRLWLLGRASAVIEDERGTLFPFAVETAARGLLGAPRLAVVRHRDRRLLVVEASSDDPAIDVAGARQGLAWAHLDDVRIVRRLPLDRRHNSKVDYGALRKLLDD